MATGQRLLLVCKVNDTLWQQQRSKRQAREGEKGREGRQTAAAAAAVATWPLGCRTDADKFAGLLLATRLNRCLSCCRAHQLLHLYLSPSPNPISSSRYIYCHRDDSQQVRHALTACVVEREIERGEEEKEGRGQTAHSFSILFSTHLSSLFSLSFCSASIKGRLGLLICFVAHADVDCFVLFTSPKRTTQFA